MIGPKSLSTILVIAVLACTGEVDRGAEFGFDPDTATPAADVNVLRMDRTAAVSGVARLDADVLLPLGISEATARATLRHLIDSLAAADTMAGAVRVTGFMLDPQTGDATEVQVNPVIMARWIPLDTIGVTGRNRTARYRTHFVLLEPLPLSPGSSRP